MEYRDPKTGNLELFPILNIEPLYNLTISTIAEWNKIFAEYGIEPISTLDEIPKTFQLYNEKILKECNTALESKKVGPVESLNKLAEAINEIMSSTPPALSNLKGKTIIELTNVNTGEVTTYEDEQNLITYGANKYINTGYVNYNSYRTAKDMLPVSKKALGGVLLFDNTLEEDPNNYHLPDPSVAKLIGHAGREISTNPVDDTRGSFIAEESGFIENGYKSVWSFDTSKGNGNISNICLTNHIFGYLGLKNWGDALSNFYIDSPSANYPIYDAYYTKVTYNFCGWKDSFSGSLSMRNCIPSVLYSNNEENTLNEIEEYVNIYLSDNSTLNYQKWIDRKNNVCLKEYSQYEKKEEKDITIDPNTLDNINYIYFTSFQRNPKDNKYYSIASYNGKLVVVKFDLETQKLEKEMSLSLRSTLNTKYAYGNMRSNFVIRDNNFYIPLLSSNNILLFKIDLLNKKYINLNNKIRSLVFDPKKKSTNITITPNETIIMPGGLLDKNDNFYSGSSNFLTSNDTTSAYAVEVGGTLITNSLISTRICNIHTNSDYYCTIPNIFYLGSINNLSTPITKTSEHTMKITYILTEE